MEDVLKEITRRAVSVFSRQSVILVICHQVAVGGHFQHLLLQAVNCIVKFLVCSMSELLIKLGLCGLKLVKNGTFKCI